MLANQVGEDQVFSLGRGRWPAAGFFPFCIVAYIGLLLQNPRQERAVLGCRMDCLFLYKQDAVLFGTQDLERVGVKGRRDEHFEKDLVDRRCGGFIDGSVTGEYSAE